MTPQQKRLKKKHGTPEEFERAIWKAYADLFITEREAMGAITKSRAEWNDAG